MGCVIAKPLIRKHLKLQSKCTIKAYSISSRLLCRVKMNRRKDLRTIFEVSEIKEASKMANMPEE